MYPRRKGIPSRTIKPNRLKRVSRWHRCYPNTGNRMSTTVTEVTAPKPFQAAQSILKTSSSLHPSHLKTTGCLLGNPRTGSCVSLWWPDALTCTRPPGWPEGRGGTPEAQTLGSGCQWPLDNAGLGHLAPLPTAVESSRVTLQSALSIRGSTSAERAVLQNLLGRKTRI